MLHVLKKLVHENRYFKYHLILIILFTFIYNFASNYVHHENDRKEVESLSSSFYHAVMTQFTVAPLNAPTSPLLRILCIVQVLIAIMFLNL